MSEPLTATTTRAEDEREAFLQWVSKRPYSPSQIVVEWIWDAWQARAALATAPEQAGEPVAWMTKSDGYVFYGYNKPDRVEEELVPLYTAPPPASTNRLTDEQIKDIAVQAGIACIDGNGRHAAWPAFPASIDGFVVFARAIIAAAEGK